MDGFDQQARDAYHGDEARQAAQLLEQEARDESEEVVDGEIEYAIVPWTGELLALGDLSDEAIAGVLDEAREFEQVQMRALKRDLQDELLRRMDAQVAWTIRLEDGTVLTGDGPNRTEWDVPSLRCVLDHLVKEGYLTQEAADKGIREKTTYEASASGLNALLKLGGDVAAMIETCRLPSSKPRSVQVKRS